MINNFPYTNFHELNTDWIINAIKEIQADMANEFKLTLNNYFNTIMPQVIYDDVLEEITLKFIPIVGEGVHSYTAGDDTLNIMEV